LQDSSKIAAAGATVSGLLAAQPAVARTAFAGGSDTIRLGLIGAGGRGTGAAIHAMNTQSGNVELVAAGDAFEKRLNLSLKTCSTTKNGKFKDQVIVPDDKQHVGLDAYKRVLGDPEVDMVILATPPGFRPLHFESAINADKHVFMEKPVAVDAPGVRRVLKAGELAKQKNLAVAVGLQRRHERAYRETIEKLQDGIIGDLIHSRVYWNGGGVWTRPRQADQTELEYQTMNWYYFNWLCGDHIAEQHIHNLDVANWMMDGYPEKAQGMGGRQVRIGEDTGQIYDHHTVEFTYANGHKMLSQCRHQKNTWRSVSEHVHGSKGYANIGAGKIWDKNNELVFETKAGRDGHQQEHHDLFADIRNGIIPNEAEYGAKSTMTAIFGRMATYSGQEILWKDAIESKITHCDVDSLTGFDDEAPFGPDKNGNYPIPIPGQKVELVCDWLKKKRRR
jgi:predicted dehydrogenase